MGGTLGGMQMDKDAKYDPTVEQVLGSIKAWRDDLVTVAPETDLGTCLKLMDKKHVLSLAVMKADGTMIGMLEILDIVAYVVFGIFKEEVEPDNEALSGEKLTKVTAEDVIGLSTEIETQQWHNGVFEVTPETPISEVMSLNSSGVERVIVNDGAKKRILTQTDVVRFLLQNISYFGEIANETIEDAGLVAEEEFNHLIVVQHNELALIAMRKILKNRGNAVAVFYNSGKLVATLSPTDLCKLYVLDHGRLDRLLLPVTEFLDFVQGGALRRPITCTATDTIEAAMQKMVSGKVHRVWTVDGNRRPIGCLRAQDVIVKFGPIDYKHHNQHQ